MKGYKTILFGILVAVVTPLITYLDGLKETLAQCGIDPTTNLEVCGLPSWIGIVVGIAIIALRAVTTTSIFQK